MSTSQGGETKRILKMSVKNYKLTKFSQVFCSVLVEKLADVIIRTNEQWYLKSDERKKVMFVEKTPVRTVEFEMSIGGPLNLALKTKGKNKLGILLSDDMFHGSSFFSCFL